MLTFGRHTRSGRTKLGEVIGLIVVLSTIVCIFATQCFADIVTLLVIFPDVDKEKVGGTTQVRRVKVGENAFLEFKCKYTKGGEVLMLSMDYVDEEFFAKNQDEGELKKKLTVKDTNGRELAFEFQWSVKRRKSGKVEHSMSTASVEPVKQPDDKTAPGEKRTEVFTLKTTENKKIEFRVEYQ